MIRFSAIALALLSISTACSYSTTSTTTISNGDSVSNLNGKGVGTVAGVEIEVLELSKHNSGVTHSVRVSETSSGASQAETWDVQFGEVSVVMDREGSGPIDLQVDDQSYGTLNEGDQLLIDADRNVIVNDIPRNAL